jgi:hypothetical protein
MTIEQLLRELNIHIAGSYTNKSTYVIDLEDSNEYGRIYSLLERSDLLELISDTSFLNSENGSMEYQYEDEEGTIIQLSLIANWDNDEYKLVVMKVGE